MPQKEVTITNKLGIHARPAAQFVKLAHTFDAEISVTKEDYEIDGKSIMGLMTLAAGHGSVILIETKGPQADEALAALSDLVSNGFSEPVA